jgi:TATA-box binding protein (TBP) (component of TFIID and TFIIIB)
MSATIPTDINYTTPTMEISPIRISTMVTTCHIDTLIDLAKLFDQIKTIQYWDLTDGVLKMEFHSKTKGVSWKDLMQKPEKTAKTFFFNQATIVIRREIAPLQWKEINIKLFRNGGIQMTGVRSEQMSLDAITWLVNNIQTTCSDSVFEKPPRIHKMQIQLVNTDFSIGAKIRREALYKVMSEKYHLTVSYEPSIYQGVKTKYFYNSKRPATCPPGLCPCEKLCKGTGNGEEFGDCKKITISPFQTGQIIITGARTMDQINDAYEFMKQVFKDNANEVLRKNYICPDAPGTTAETPTSKSSGWIHHPSPRNIVRMELRKIR